MDANRSTLLSRIASSYIVHPMIKSIVSLALVCGACASPGDDLLGEVSQNGLAVQPSAGWSPRCGRDSASQPIRAVSFAGVWAATAADAARYSPSTTQFTLACRGKTIAKCVELGYRTYKGYTDQLTSCVRL